MRSYNLQDQQEEFFYLMDLPLPVPEYHEHYATMLAKVDPSLSSAAYDYQYTYLPWCQARGYASSQEYRRNKAIPDFVEWANNSSTFDSLVLMQSTKHVFKPMDRCLEMRGELLLRIRMVYPDFSVMKLVSLQRDVFMFESWHELCDTLNIPRFLSNSKVFMEDCFDHYEPEKRLELQRHIIGKLVESFEKEHKMVYVSPTEVIIRYPEKGLADIILKLNEIYGRSSCIKYELTPIRDVPLYDNFIKKEVHNELEMELQVLEEKKVLVLKSQRYEEAAQIRDKERKILQSLGDLYREQFDKKCVNAVAHPIYSLRKEYILQKGEMIESQKQLIGVPDNKFYTYFRTMIMHELLEEKDLMFMHDGRAASWVTEKQN